MKKTEILFKKVYDGEYAYLPISDIPQEFLVPENKIMIHTEEGYHDNNGWNIGCTTIEISHEREMNEEEKEEMRQFILQKRAESKEERRKEYLKLKKEFEDE